MLYKEQSTTDDMEFLAMLAHDMKTPVKAQVVAMNLLYSGAFGKFSQDANNLILNIIASNKYLQLLLDNVLGNYRINSGKLILNKTKNDIRKTIEESIDSISVLFKSKNQKIEVKYLADNFINVYDEIEIQRVIINILSNAFEYSDENSTIGVNVKTIDKKLNVEIKSAVKLNVFKNSENKKLNHLKAGSGLGLKICKNIIELHGGEIYIENTQKNEFLINFKLP